MRYFALLKDSLLEALDRKSLYVMMVISFIFIVMLASVSYSPMDIPDVLQDMVGGFNGIAAGRGAAIDIKEFPLVTFRISQVRELGPDAGVFREGFEFKLDVAPKDEFHRLVRTWDAYSRRVIKRPDDPLPDSTVDADLEVKFLRQKLMEAMVPHRDISPLPSAEGTRAFQVRMKPTSREGLNGAFKMHIGFGIYSFKLPVSVALTTFFFQQVLSEYMAGWVGVMIGLVFTAAFVPNMLQKGSLDVLLAKPVRRTTLLVYKFIGGLTYAAITGAIFIGGSWLVISARAGVWNWGYLATYGTLMLFFAVLYSIGVLTAVLSRSTVAAILVPIVFWALGSGVNLVKNSSGRLRLPPWVPTTLEGVSWFLPRAGDINAMNNWFMLRGSFGPEVDELVKSMQMDLPEIQWVKILVSSGLMILVMISASCLIFSRRDH